MNSREEELQMVVTAQRKGRKFLFLIIGIVAVIVMAVILVFRITAAGGDDVGKTTNSLDLGNKYLEEMDYERAIMAYQAVLEIDPKNADAYMGLIDAYGAKEDAGQIAEIYRKAVEELTGEKDAAEFQKVRTEAEAQLENLIRAALAAGDYAKAADYAEQLAKVDETKAETMRAQIADAKEKAEAELQAELQAELVAKEEEERQARLAVILEGVGTGEVITFGHYEQDNDMTNGTEPIEWVVLAREEGRALLVSVYGLDARLYHEERIAVTWENCDLRKWLNNSFYDAAFDVEEKERVVQVTNENPDSYAYFQTDYARNRFDWDISKEGAKGGNPTEDKVFLLSWEDALNYFASDEARCCYPTAYAMAQRAFHVNVNHTCAWWLRSPAIGQKEPFVIRRDGWMGNGGLVTDLEMVRPALWITE